MFRRRAKTPNIPQARAAERSRTVNGKHEVVKIDMKPEIVDPEDIEMLQDLLIASINEAMRKADETSEREMGKITGGLNIPGMPGGLF